MNLGKVVGVVVATKKIESLKGIKFYVVEPRNENSEKKGGNTFPSRAGSVADARSGKYLPLSNLLVAADTVSSTMGDEVIWVSSREAALALEETFNPVDAAIVGIVDSI